MAWKPDRERGTRSQRGYGHKWQKLRKLVLARDNYLCQPCKALGILTAATQVDHIIPKAHGGTDDSGQLQAICDKCHATKTRQDQLKAAPKGCDANGIPNSSRHHWK